MNTNELIMIKQKLNIGDEMYYLKDQGYPTYDIVLAKIKITKEIKRARDHGYLFEIIDSINGVINSPNIPRSVDYFTKLDKLREGILKIFEKRKENNKFTQLNCQINNKCRQQETVKANDEIFKMEAQMDRDVLQCGKFLEQFVPTTK